MDRRYGDGYGYGKTQSGSRYCKMEQREGEKRQRTKLPASPPAINATPINKITLALQAAGPSDPHASPENAEWRWVLSSRETIRNPTDLSAGVSSPGRA